MPRAHKQTRGEPASAARPWWHGPTNGLLFLLVTGALTAGYLQTRPSQETVCQAVAHHLEAFARTGFARERIEADTVMVISHRLHVPRWRVEGCLGNDITHAGSRTHQ